MAAETCRTEHPDQPGVYCERIPPCWGYHAQGRITWPSDIEHPGTRASQTKSKRAQIISSTQPRRTPRPVTVGSPTSEEAWRRYEPKADTAKGRVLGYLRERMDQWVDAPVLTSDDVGGFAGTRRLRELREDGWLIETRPKPGGTNTWQHRLVSPGWVEPEMK